MDTDALNHYVANERKALSRAITIQTCVGIASVVLMLFSFLTGAVQQGFGLFFLALIINVGLYIMYTHSCTKRYRSKVKDYIMLEVFSREFNGVSFNPQSGLGKDLMIETGVIDTGNRFSSNDLMKGNYKGVDFERCDVLSQNVQQSGKTTTTITYFKGQVYVFDFHKPSHNYVRIRDAGMWNKFSKGRRTDGSRKMKFEDTEFNEMFVTFSNDEHEAFYIFTPHFMNKVKQLRQAVGCEISLVIRKGILYLALYTSRDSFEAPLFGEIDIDYTRAVAMDVRVIKEIITELDLDNTLFKEET
ncbi:DUF3137 domain-containing protein [Erysipelothrix sp. HDW6C]|uniref:DUF3137 domain-containing protein n=1 Tax=Erysipelothrix sp. HDW6C TaxID=2714930 RepID=UPI00140C852B|nr:DUF3137 domain-containing protein [Erysipelothrix sp. HDW6C]QIK70601.1 DUF3137 domain-containing protein [Erysipelothrix sp. HDW6C]